MYLFRNVRHCFQTILKEEGGFWRGCLYRGLSPTLMVIIFNDDVIANDIISNSLLLQGIAPYVGLNFAVYETLKGKEYWLVWGTKLLHVSYFQSTFCPIHKTHSCQYHYD